MSAVDIEAAPVRISANAAKRVAEIIQGESNPNLKLRLSVSGGGCSGFQYAITLDETETGDDVAIRQDNVTVLIDTISLEYLRGSELDFVEDLSGSSFQIRNPNATSKCGCGSSFAL